MTEAEFTNFLSEWWHFDYMPGKMDVTMFSYLNKGDEITGNPKEKDNYGYFKNRS